MAKRNIAEVVAGAAVLVVALGFLGYAVANTGQGSSSGYTLHAQFDRIDGLTLGSDVRLAGVKVGSVQTESLDPKTYLAEVSFSVANDLKLPTDTSAEVVSDSLLGGKYLSLVPGGADKNIPPGGAVTITQSSVSLEELLGKFIFSVTDMVNAVKASSGGSGSGTAPAKTAP
jgi:phospholipid/cholesterol/gamma-HCH transport system substrate-binding protein